MMKQIIHFIIILLICLTGCDTSSNDWFVVERLDSRTYVISEPNSSQGNSCFLIIGEKEAILFDSGTGESKMRSITQVTDSLTKLPVTLLLSHFHFDHIGNINEFNRIGIPEIELLKNRLSADKLLNLDRSEVLSKDKVTLKISRMYAVGKEIDLGNRRIKIVHTPGHSKESISIIDNENEYVFTGDLVYNGLLLLNDCDAYIHSIDKIINNSNSNYRIFGSHGKPEVNYERLAQIKKAIESHHAGNCINESVHQINLFGFTKDVYKIGNISFIDGYTDVFTKE